jgi:hypothetical protein
MTHLLLHVKRHFQPVRKLGLLQRILRWSDFGRLLFASKQWGRNYESTSNGYGVNWKYPITFNNKVLAIIPFDINGDWSDTAIPNIHAAWYPENGSDKNNLQWARIGFSEKNTTFSNYGFVAIGK